MPGIQQTYKRSPFQINFCGKTITFVKFIGQRYLRPTRRIEKDNQHEQKVCIRYLFQLFMEQLIPGVIVILCVISDGQFIFSDDCKKIIEEQGDKPAKKTVRKARTKILTFLFSQFSRDNNHLLITKCTNGFKTNLV